MGPADAGAWTIHATVEHVSVSESGACLTAEALLEKVRAANGEEG